MDSRNVRAGPMCTYIFIHIISKHMMCFRNNVAWDIKIKTQQKKIAHLPEISSLPKLVRFIASKSIKLITTKRKMIN